MYTKKDLEVRFNISDVTVISTMQACGINTKKKKHSQAELDRFQLARKLADEGKTYKEIEEYFAIQEEQVLEEEEVEEPEFDASELINNQKEALASTISQTLGHTVSDIAEESAKKIAELVPALALAALNQELNSEEFIQKIRSNKQRTESSIPAFLLQKIHITQIKHEPQKLNGKEQKQLPQSSPENSSTES
jgi:hypothetical protein